MPACHVVDVKLKDVADSRSPVPPTGIMPPIWSGADPLIGTAYAWPPTRAGTTASAPPRAIMLADERRVNFIIAIRTKLPSIVCSKRHANLLGVVISISYQKARINVWR